MIILQPCNHRLLVIHFGNTYSVHPEHHPPPSQCKHSLSKRASHLRSLVVGMEVKQNQFILSAGSFTQPLQRPWHNPSGVSGYSWLTNHSSTLITCTHIAPTRCYLSPCPTTLLQKTPFTTTATCLMPTFFRELPSPNR